MGGITYIPTGAVKIAVVVKTKSGGIIGAFQAVALDGAFHIQVMYDTWQHSLGMLVTLQAIEHKIAGTARVVGVVNYT